MSLSPSRVRVSVLAIIACFALAACGGSRIDTPTHVVAVYFDGVNHGDFRQACQQIQPAVKQSLWHGQSGCETYFAAAFGQMAQFFGLGGYSIVEGSYVGWREGSASVAQVTVSAGQGALLHVRLVKTARYGWKIAAIS